MKLANAGSQQADTTEGLESIRAMAGIGVPYAMLLCERFLGRPFAGHRDSVSKLIGDNLESAIEEILSAYGISIRKTYWRRPRRPSRQNGETPRNLPLFVCTSRRYSSRQGNPEFQPLTKL